MSSIKTKITRALSLLGLLSVLTCVLNILALNRINTLNSSSEYLFREYKGADTVSMATMETAFFENMVHSERRVHGTIIFNFFFILVIFITIIFIVRYVVKVISKPLEEMTDSIKHIAEGDMTVEFEAPSIEHPKDEVIRIKKSMQHMTTQLRSMMTHIKNSSMVLNEIAKDLDKTTRTTSEISDDISKAVEEVANGALEQTHNTQGITQKVTIMGDNIERIRSNTSALLNTSTNMTEMKEVSMSAIDTLEHDNGLIMGDVSKMNEQIKITSASVENIKKSVEIIKQISSQTNLLSFNASIEASRAGEYGLGFSVVASEIRKLAEQSKESSDEIASTIKELLDNYKLIIEEMGRMTENLQSQSDKISDAKNIFKDLERGINDTTEQIISIDKEIVNLDNERANIVDSICSLSAISEENSASSEETSISIVGLNQIVTEVFEKVQRIESHSTLLIDSVNEFKTE